ncbi:uroporphyrinogen-III synthase [Marinicellulosiphila megalodicopiae]|uniref:uroporphyrinogen-III synthase n=1 Tax=Marinicellulosiphila megalodicopiae TaxID=2724896 RepID=UPI003BB127B0
MSQIFITRPEGQADELMHLLNQSKHNSKSFVHWPLCKIENIELTGKGQTWLYEFDLYDYVFVVSKHAAYLLCEFLDERWPMLPIGPEFICPGSGTASVLKKYGIIAKFPDQQMDSEGVLNLAMFTDESLSENKKWLVVSGKGGRRKISAKLMEHNQQIDELDLYERILKQNLPNKAFNKNDVIVITSKESLIQAQKLLGDRTQQLNLWVPSNRIKQSAQNWQNVLIMKNASDQTIIQTVESHE